MTQSSSADLHHQDHVDRPFGRKTFRLAFRFQIDSGAIVPVGLPVVVHSRRVVPTDRVDNIDGMLFFEAVSPDGSPPTGPVPDLHQRMYFGEQLIIRDDHLRARYPHGAVRLSRGEGRWIIALRPEDGCVS